MSSAIGPLANVMDVTVHPEGRRIATGSLDRTVRLWDLERPESPPLVLRGHAGNVRGVAFRSLDRNLTRVEWSDLVGRDWPYRRTCPELPEPRSRSTPETREELTEKEGTYI